MCGKSGDFIALEGDEPVVVLTICITDFMVVDLPAPLGPRITVCWPASMVNEILLRARVVVR